jgi:pimeloyl-ACP methyl ester carboxylesterase
MIRFYTHPFLTVAAMFGVALSAMDASAYFGKPGTQVAVKRSQNTSPYGYYEYLPIGYSDTGAKVPVVLFLHGLGERGDGETTLYRVKKLGPPMLADTGKDFPAIVVSPQASTSGYWNKTTINQFVDYIFATYKAADRSRLYVTGLSMGGAGAWDYSTAYPSRVAAVVPVCGGSSGDRSNLYGKPIWAFHAFDDRVVPLSRTTNNLDTITRTSVSMISGYPKVGTGPAATDMIALFSQSKNSHRWIVGNTTTDIATDNRIRYTVYRSGGHNAWTRAYENNQMWNWLFRQATSVSSPSPTREIRVDFGDNGVSLPSGWNNGRGLVHSGSIALKTSTGVLTPYDLTTLTAFNDVSREGTKSPNSTLGFPIATTQDSFFGNDVIFNGTIAPKAVLEIRDLDPAKAYTFKFFASRMGVTDVRQARYGVYGATTSIVNLNASNNTSVVATTAPVKPSSSGVIRIQITKGTQNTNSLGVFYLGSMRILY